MHYYKDLARETAVGVEIRKLLRDGANRHAMAEGGGEHISATEAPSSDGGASSGNGTSIVGEASFGGCASSCSEAASGGDMYSGSAAAGSGDAATGSVADTPAI